MKEIYAWVPWFQELAGKVAEGGEAGLIERAKQVEWTVDNPILLRYGDENIDPFSFFYFLAQCNGRKNREEIYKNVNSAFGISEENSLSAVTFSDGFIIPTPTFITPVLFHNNGAGDPKLLWKLFRKAISDEDLTSNDFKKALEIQNVGVAKLTQTMFLINPKRFMPVDKGILKHHDTLDLPPFKEIRRKIAQPDGLKYYNETVLSKFRAAFPQQDFYEINTSLYLTSIAKKDSKPIQNDGEKNQPHGDDKMKHPLNQILYGPPGTGKTWNTVNHALAIIEGTTVEELEKEDRQTVKQRFDELKESGQIEMVTFHQNFSYEDFIEGIKPVLGDDSGNVRYEIVDGVFKDISKQAKENLTKYLRKTETFDLDVLLRDFAQYINDKIDQGEEIKLYPETNSPTLLAGARTLNNGKIQFNLALGKLPTNYDISSNIVLRDYMKFISGEIETYRDIKPTHKSKSSCHGDASRLFPLMQKIKTYQDSEWQTVKQTTEEKQNYVLIIDEINRGNIAKIFGELITLIEDTKRIGNKDQMTVTLPYSSNSDDEDDSFGVPNNLYIIGTMNTADRSIALLDTALRRRFDFIEMMPKPDHSLISDNVEGVNCQELLAMMNKRITALLDREHQIGHSYLMGIGSMEKLARVFQHRIIPLLQEYFYDDWAKIDIVLNKNKFVTATKIESTLFSDTELVDADRLIYELIDADDYKWTSSDSYIQIYAPKQRRADDDE